MSEKIQSLRNLWKYPHPFMLEVTVRSADIDSYHHANNAVYAGWIDECARQHSKAVGIDTIDAGVFGYGMAVRENHITYYAPAHLGDELLVGNWFTYCDGKLRATREFQVLRVSDGKTLVSARMDLICIRIDSGKPTRMPSLFKERYVVTEEVQTCLNESV